MSNYLKRFSKVTRLGFSIVLLLSGLVGVHAQGGLNLVGRVKVDGGSLSGTKVVVMKEGRKVKTLTDGLAKFEIVLDLNSNYIFSFEKEGFVTKKLQFNTNVEGNAEEKIYAPFGFTVNLFEQYDDVNIVVFNQPVGMIRYERDLEEFDYDTDYTKSIQSQLDDAMKAIEAKKKEAAKNAKRQEKEKAKQEELAAKEREKAEQAAAEETKAKEEEKQVQERLAEEKESPNQEESVEEKQQPQEEDQEEPVQRNKPEVSTQRDRNISRPVFNAPDRARVNTGEANRGSSVVMVGQESSPVRIAQAVAASESAPDPVEMDLTVERFEDIIVEKTRVITKVKFVSEDGEDEYLKVYHKWGGTFYFKNGASCSQNVFELETRGYEVVSTP